MRTWSSVTLPRVPGTPRPLRLYDTSTRQVRPTAPGPTALFREDMEALRVLPPRQFVGAVESIPEIVEVIAKLLADGAAYRADDPEYPDIYFDHAVTGRFGYESGYDAETMAKFFAER